VHFLPITLHRLVRLGRAGCDPNGNVTKSWHLCKEYIEGERGLLLTCPFLRHPSDDWHGSYRHVLFTEGKPMQIAINQRTGEMETEVDEDTVFDGEHFQCSGNFRVGERPGDDLIDDVNKLLEQIDERGWDGQELVTAVGMEDGEEEEEEEEEEMAAVQVATWIGARMRGGDRRRRTRVDLDIQHLVEREQQEEEDEVVEEEEETCMWVNVENESENVDQQVMEVVDADFDEDETEGACEYKPLCNAVLGGYCSKHTFECLVELLKFTKNLQTMDPNVKEKFRIAEDYAEKKRKKGKLKFGAVNHRRIYVDLLHELRLQNLRAVLQ
jgi:hypothetical protein